MLTKAIEPLGLHFHYHMIIASHVCCFFVLVQYSVVVIFCRALSGFKSWVLCKVDPFYDDVICSSGVVGFEVFDHFFIGRGTGHVFA